ncbi:MAG: hypothetical protein JWR90_4035 [Marmoricola sp.]|nr:hypothetical protein [Marmoricola sp.]
MTSSQIDEQLVWLCDEVVSATGVTGCGVMMTTDGGQGITAHASDRYARSAEDLQQTLGEGPGVAASASGAVVLVPDLGDVRDTALSRWPTFAREAIGLGVHAAFAFPLLLGASRLGALSLYRLEAGALSPEHVSHGRVTADAVALRLADPTGTISNNDLQIDPMRVHQAAGMVMVQLGIPIDQALLRLRAAAYADGLSVDELADAIVQRRRRLSKEDG